MFSQRLFFQTTTQRHRCFEIVFQAAVRNFQSMLVCPLLHGLHPRFPFCVITSAQLEWLELLSARCGRVFKFGAPHIYCFPYESGDFYCIGVLQCVTHLNFETHPCWRHDVQLRLDIGVINPRGASNETYIEAVPGRLGIPIFWSRVGSRNPPMKVAGSVPQADSLILLGGRWFTIDQGCQNWCNSDGDESGSGPLDVYQYI